MCHRSNCPQGSGGSAQPVNQKDTVIIIRRSPPFYLNAPGLVVGGLQSDCDSNGLKAQSGGVLLGIVVSHSTNLYHNLFTGPHTYATAVLLRTTFRLLLLFCWPIITVFYKIIKSIFKKKWRTQFEFAGLLTVPSFRNSK